MIDNQSLMVRPPLPGAQNEEDGDGGSAALTNEIINANLSNDMFPTSSDNFQNLNSMQ